MCYKRVDMPNTIPVGFVAAFKRNRYFSGKLLTEQDLADEQTYHLAVRRTLNRTLHGWGIASGLGVSFKNGSMVIEPGLALDGLGRELFVPDLTTVPPPGEPGAWWLVLCHADRETDPIPAIGVSQAEGIQNSRIQEGVDLVYVDRNPCLRPGPPGPDCIAIAAVRWVRAAWRLEKRPPCRRIR
jgi:hypothetical protein